MSRFPRPRSRAPLPQERKEAWTIRFKACVCAALLLAAPAAVCGDAAAQAYPARPIRMIVAFPAGGPTDLQARVVAKKLGEALGQQVVVDNRGGAGGMIGADLAAKAAPDGYTLFFGTISMVLAPTFTAKPSYDPVKDFAAITMVSTAPFLVLVHPSIPARSMKEFIALAKARPGQLAFSTSGNGTPPHLAGELFKTMAGIDIVHVPFREANSALNSVIQGATQMSFVIASIASAQMSGGTVRGLAVTSKQASALVPGIPPVAQAGLPGFEVIGWNGFVAPKATPQPVIAKLSEALIAGLGDAELRKRVTTAGYEPAEKNSPGQFAAFIAADTSKWLDLVAKTNMKAN